MPNAHGILCFLSVNGIYELTVAEEDADDSTDACCDQGSKRKHLDICEDEHRRDSESRHSTSHRGRYYVDLLEVLLEYKYCYKSTYNRNYSTEEDCLGHFEEPKNSVYEISGTKKLMRQPGYCYITKSCTYNKNCDVMELEAKQSYYYTDNKSCKN